eukprot:GHVR01082977.1.p1 GENE.GHVR01082977.1~~GHVR01082977.1.p1  ORF type:complete len:190 (+),score=34.15 GHVR01082977.1:839-1408(+)
MGSTHLLDCKKGGQVLRRHNEMRDVLAELFTSVFPSVQTEVIVQDAIVTPPKKNALVGDIKARGVSERQTDTIFDVSVIDTDAPSHRDKDPIKVLNRYSDDKKKKYQQACDARRAFIPLIFALEGTTSTDTQHFLCHLAKSLANKRCIEYADAIALVRSRVSLTTWCTRGVRSKWRTAHHQNTCTHTIH